MILPKSALKGISSRDMGSLNSGIEKVKELSASISKR